MTDRELMQQALEALEALTHSIDTEELLHDDQRSAYKQCIATITALRERLAQPEQEPVAWKQAIRGLTDQCAALVWERDELQKQVWRYEQHGVTCQTYRHKVKQSCSECNVQEKYT